MVNKVTPSENFRITKKLFWCEGGRGRGLWAAVANRKAGSSVVAFVNGRGITDIKIAVWIVAGVDGWVLIEKGAINTIADAEALIYRVASSAWSWRVS